jgi:hypothetical protein
MRRPSQYTGALTLSLSHLHYDSTPCTILQISSKSYKLLVFIEDETQDSCLLDEVPSDFDDLSEVAGISENLVIFKSGKHEVVSSHVQWIVDGIMNEGTKWQVRDDGRVVFFKPISRSKYSDDKKMEEAESALFPRHETNYDYSASNYTKDKDYNKTADYLYGDSAPSSKKKNKK